MRTFADYFSGGGGAAIGARLAGLVPIWGVEYDPDIASVADLNLGAGHSIAADVCRIDPRTLTAPYWYHMSPVCTRASVAKRERGEAVIDRRAGAACCRAIRTFLSPVVSLENVWGYRKFKSFARILQTLEECGYRTAYWKLMAADYGVPQTRERLILVARRDGRDPVMPSPTHAKEGAGGLPPWVGWFASVEDILDTLPESQFAPWQLKRLPEKYQTMLVTDQYDKPSSDADTARA